MGFLSIKRMLDIMSLKRSWKKENDYFWLVDMVIGSHVIFKCSFNICLYIYIDLGGEILTLNLHHIAPNIVHC
jgi:hypothetical protein